VSTPKKKHEPGGSADDLAVADQVEAAVLARAHQASDTTANIRFFLAVLGAIPWVGVLITAIAARWSEYEQGQLNELHRSWLQEHQLKLEELRTSLDAISVRVDSFGEDARTRLNSDEYLSLARKGFRVWDHCETAEKRELVVRVLTNAACDKLCEDDFVRRFIEWIDDYSELHLRVVRIVYLNRGCTRRDIWCDLYGSSVREDSAEADLFKLLIRDLSTGGMLRQMRQTTPNGEFLPRRTPRKRSVSVMKSAFDEAEPYVLTELGGRFVHYAMNELVDRIGEGHE
jgi:hypothetical protein